MYKTDLLQVVSMASRYVHDPDMGHLEAVRWILRYIKGTINIGLVFVKDAMGKKECIRYVNSDYTGVYDGICIHI